MDILDRLILRLLLVPLGVVVASVVAAAFILVAEHNAWRAVLDADPDAWIDYVVAFLGGGPGALPLVPFVAYSFVPALAGVLIAEGFAIRSWLFHAANGGISIAIGWTLAQGIGDRRLDRAHLYGKARARGDAAAQGEAPRSADLGAA